MGQSTRVSCTVLLRVWLGYGLGAVAKACVVPKNADSTTCFEKCCVFESVNPDIIVHQTAVLGVFVSARGAC